MTQEIYSYLLIRNYLALENDEYSLENEDNPKDQYAFFVNTVAELMQKENYPLVFEDMQMEINDIIQKYRFTYMKDKDLNENINYIITRLSEYKQMPTSRKNYLLKDWYKSEYKKRLLPFKYCNYDYVNILLLCDFHNYEMLGDKFEVDNFVGSFSLQGNEHSVSRYASFLATMNLMVSYDNDIFTAEEKMRLITNILLLTKELDVTITDLRYAKKTATYICSTIKEEDFKILEKRLEK